MQRIIVILCCIMSLVMLPAAVIAKSDKGGNGDQNAPKGPTPNPTAYEHADENAKFLRDTHDLGQHKGQEEEKTKDQDADNEEQGKGKSKEKSKGKGKGKGKKGKDDDTASGKSKSGDDDVAGQKGDKGNGKEGKSDADALLEQVGQGKGKGKK